MPSKQVAVSRAVVAVALVGAVGIAGCGDDDEVTSVNVVNDLGATDGRALLPPAAEVGHAAMGTIAMKMEIAVSAGAQSEEVAVEFAADVAMEVTEVDADDGSYTTLQEWTHVDIAADAPGGDLDVPSSFTLEITYDRNGAEIDSELLDADAMSADERDTAEQFAGESGSRSTISFPDEPIGVGASWTETVTSTSGGIGMDIAMEYSLDELDDEGFVVDLDIDDEFSVTEEGETITGSMTGSGTFGGSPTNPLVNDGQMTMTVEGSGGGASLDMTIDVQVALHEPGTGAAREPLDSLPDGEPDGSLPR